MTDKNGMPKKQKPTSKNSLKSKNVSYRSRRLYQKSMTKGLVKCIMKEGNNGQWYWWLV